MFRTLGSHAVNAVRHCRRVVTSTYYPSTAAAAMAVVTSILIVGVCMCMLAIWLVCGCPVHSQFVHSFCSCCLRCQWNGRNSTQCMITWHGRARRLLLGNRLHQKNIMNAFLSWETLLKHWTAETVAICVTVWCVTWSIALVLEVAAWRARGSFSMALLGRVLFITANMCARYLFADIPCASIMYYIL